MNLCQVQCVRWTRAALAGVLAAIACLICSATPVAASVATSQAEYDAMLLAYGYDPPAGTCMDAPFAYCEVERAVVYPPQYEGDFATVPLLDPARIHCCGMQSQHHAGAGKTCGVTSRPPERTLVGGETYMMAFNGFIHCWSGEGVTKMQVITDLYRDCERGDGWCYRATTGWVASEGAGVLYSPRAYYDCDHDQTRLYRAQTLAFTRQRGTSYTAAHRKHAATDCPY